VRPEKKITVRATEAEIILWKEAAWAQRKTLSEYVREILNALAPKHARRADGDS
jgi:hypothetical protein